MRRRGAILLVSLFYIPERNVLREFHTSHFISRCRLGILLMRNCQGVSHIYGVFAHRNPVPRPRNDGECISDLPTRRASGPLPQEPPRITLDSPVGWSCRIPRRAGLIIVRVIPVADPFPDIPRHVIDAIGALSVFKSPHRCQCAVVVPMLLAHVRKKLRWMLISPGIGLGYLPPAPPSPRSASVGRRLPARHPRGHNGVRHPPESTLTLLGVLGCWHLYPPRAVLYRVVLPGTSVPAILRNRRPTLEILIS